MAIREDHYENGVLHMVDDRIQPEDYEKGLVGSVRINMNELELELADFIFKLSMADLDTDTALFCLLEAIDQMVKHDQIKEHVGVTIADLSHTIYDAVKHNEEVASDERDTPSAE